MALKILEVGHVLPLPPSSLTHTSLPLSFLDLFWLRSQPVQRLFFYSSHPRAHDDYEAYFFDSVIPKLKHSLSVALQHFLPIAGKIVWPQESQKPFIKYSPGSDGVSFTVAQSDADFDKIANHNFHQASESLDLLPHLHTSQTSTSVVALQVTLFPKRGFSIGIATHHAILDGKSSIMFLKAWAYFCRENKESSSLPKELNPILDRSFIRDTKGFGKYFLKELTGSDVENANTSVEILPELTGIGNMEELVQATFTLDRKDIDKLKKKVLSMWDKVGEGERNLEKPVKLSTFVLSCAHMLVSIAKAVQLDESNNFVFGFTGDYRSRMEPPTDPNYFGNCVAGCMVIIEHREIYSDEGLAFVCRKICEEIERLDEDALGRAEHVIQIWGSVTASGNRIVGVSGSPRFRVYETDFGWGKPDKVEIPSVYRTGSIALAECRDEDGIEIGYACSRHEMDILTDAFYKDLHV